ncbi:MAG: DUF1080 domain-containing protein [Gloeobacteraceae cyanobacterium ES-bin-144]|nr:DUF1080 domain-containing protein [Verrucomicrobiales bacterium]
MKSSDTGIRWSAILVILMIGGSAVHAEQSWQSLWNGKDLTGWTTWLAKPHPSAVIADAAKNDSGEYAAPIGLNRDPLGVFRVVSEDGQPAIRISGQVFGGMRSEKSFANYRLKLQFKWGEKKWPPREKDDIPRDSGLLYHAHSEPGAEGRTWERSIEMQIQEHDVGDLYAIGSMIYVRSKFRGGMPKPMYDYDPKGAWNVFSQVPGMDGRCVKNLDAERPNGEWNDVEIVCLGPDCFHIVNGKVVMRLYGPTRIDTPTPQAITAGSIIIQSEGAEVFYREIFLQPITELPAEYKLQEP